MELNLQYFWIGDVLLCFEPQMDNDVLLCFGTFGLGTISLEHTYNDLNTLTILLDWGPFDLNTLTILTLIILLDWGPLDLNTLTMA